MVVNIIAPTADGEPVEVLADVEDLLLFGSIPENDQDPAADEKGTPAGND